jgi:hypothetical protein
MVSLIVLYDLIQPAVGIYDLQDTSGIHCPFHNIVVAEL